MHKTMQRLILGMFLVLALAALGSAVWRHFQPGTSPGPLETVTIATSVSYVGTCPVWAAQQKGYFAREGVAVQMQPHTSGKSALAAALQGKADLGTVADIPIMFAALDQQPVAVVATIFKAEKDHGLVARAGADITGPAGLKGKRVGLTFGTSAHFVLNAMLNRQRLAASDVTLHNMQAEDFSGAMARGEVDVISSWEPYLGMLQLEQGGKGALMYADELYEIPYNIAGGKEYVVSHPETIKKLLRALIAGARYCREEPVAAQAMTAAVLKTKGNKWRELWPTYRFEVSLDQGLLLALEDETRWALATRLASGPMPNYLLALDFKPLKAVAPGAVTVIH